jgi:hypothetical protein
MWPVIARKRFCSFNKALLRYGRRDLTWWIVLVERTLKHLRAVCYVKPRAKALLTSPWAICPSKHLAAGPVGCRLACSLANVRSVSRLANKTQLT